ncbi:phiSA1p31-related protein [Streptomyces sp. NPDC004528]|uniref:phiSA1p31-related protein n=1 Tax=Streptomyces sp. NPDC004528 TaxID=3154550 RepID=UPI0033BE211D
MEATFKVGDKVEHRSWGAGEIAFGPYLRDGSTDNYLMKTESGDHYLTGAEAMTMTAKFKVGDTANGALTGRSLKILAGPFTGRMGVAWYAVEYPEGHAGKENERNLLAPEPVPFSDAGPVKVGDVIRILKDGAFHADVKRGDLFEVKSLVSYLDRVRVDAAPGARMSQWNFRPEDYVKVPADEAAVHDGVVYDLTAKYRDKDRDVWTLARFDDVVRGGLGHIPTSRYSGDSLEFIVNEYGPLTRVDS